MYLKYILFCATALITTISTNAQICDTLDAQWLTPNPTPAVNTFGPSDYKTGIPAPSLNGVGAWDMEFYELYDTPAVGSSMIGWVQIGIGGLVDPNTNMTLDISIYNSDASGMPVGAAVNDTIGISPANDLGVPSGFSINYYWVPIPSPAAIDSSTFLVGLKMVPGDATDELFLISSTAPQGQGQGRNFVNTVLFGYVNYDGYVGLDIDLYLIPKVYVPGIMGVDVQTSCDSLTWMDGNTYYADNNTAIFELTSAGGCDSLVTLDLTINYSSSGTETVSACETYTWSANTTTYTVSGIYGTTITNAAGCDSIATLDLTINNSSAGSEAVTICDSYTWSANTTTYTVTGSYTTTLTNAAGCDSVATLNLTINTVDVGVAQVVDTLTADASSPALYQWIDCNTMNNVVGETSQSFTPTVSGDFAVVVFDNGCLDTSACFTVTITIDPPVGLDEIYAVNVTIYPNPTSGNLHVEIANPEGQIHSASITDMSGRVLIEREFATNELIFDLSEFASGSYLIHLKNTDGVVSKKFMVE